MTQLYQAYSIIDDYPTKFGRCAGLRMSWFVVDRETPVVRYEDVITGYPDGRSLAGDLEANSVSGDPAALTRAERWAYETAGIDELFTLEEMQQLRLYLGGFPRTSFHWEAVPLPAPQNRVGLSVLSVGGDTDFHMLSERDNYPLPFKVWGYYDLSLDGVRWLDRETPPTEFGLVMRATPKGLQLDYADDVAAMKFFEQHGRFLSDVE